MVFNLKLYGIVWNVLGYIKKPLRKEHLLSGKNEEYYRSLKNV